jgi:Na+-transporting methylmalonyl-CoA/oxaloacetate decarboxylase gamma subunit
MLHNKVRLTALAGCAVSVLVIAGCGAREPVEAPPAAIGPGYDAAPKPTPELMGGAAAAGDTSTPADGLLGGPSTTPTAATAPTPVYSGNSRLTTWRRADGTLVTAMAPIANPKAKPHRSVRYAPRAAAAPARRAYVAPAPVAHPVAKPVVAVKPAPRPLPVAKPAPKPVAVAPALAPLKPVVVAKPVAPLAKPPVVAPLAAKVASAKPLTKLQKLQAAVAPEATKGAVLASGESLTQGKEGQVTLSLPATLGDLIKKEAAKLGLTKAAKKTSAYADLQGEGYEITPNGRQTAVVKAGEPATFAWQVKPTPAAKGQLKTEFGVELGGAKPVQGFTLGSIAKRVAPIQDAIEEKTKGFNFAMPNLGKYETVDLPGIGKAPGKSILGGALVLLALLILVAISRNASAAKARAERRRKFRTLTDYGRNEMEFDAPKTAEVNYVNPMVAAAGGALAGAAVASAVSHHDDHGHAPAQEEHAPFDAPLDPGHHDHAAHDDDHVAPTAGAEALPVSGHGHDTHAEAAHPADHGHDTHKELEPAH